MLTEAGLQIRKAFNCSYLDEISLEGLFLRSSVPNYQKRIAGNYVTIKKIFSYTVVQPKVTNVEYAKLKENGFYPLEATSIDDMYNELMKILEWSNSFDISLKDNAQECFEIRVKELKYILANVSKARLLELEGGYRVLDRYLEFIAG